MAQIHTGSLPKVSTSSLPDSATLSGGFSAPGGTPSWRSGASPSPSQTGNPTPSTPLPAPPLDLEPRPLSDREKQLVKHLSRLQFFLATAPTRWMNNDGSSAANPSYLSGSSTSPHPYLNRFPLPNGEHVSCVFWNELYHITGTDIVRALVFRFEAFSRPVVNVKKFEEGVFSDLRNLKPGADACLEEPKSPFLDLLFRNGCIRTQKKQKVFYWFSVPHDRLFLDALERDLKREKMGLEPTTAVAGEPARSFRYDPNRGLFEQFAGKQPGLEESLNMGVPVLQNEVSIAQPLYNSRALSSESWGPDSINARRGQLVAPTVASPNDPSTSDQSPAPDFESQDQFSQPGTANSVLFSRSLFEGSPAYKQRKKRSVKKHRRGGTATTGYDTEDSGTEGEGTSHLYPEEASFEPTRQPYGSTSLFGNVSQREPSYIPTALDASTPQYIGGLPGHAAPTLLGSATQYPNQLYSSPSHDSGLHHVPSPQILPSMSPANRASNTPESFATPAQGNVPGKGFACPLISCGRLFKRLEHLKRHVRTHTQERPYECNRCSKRFSRSDNLTQHVKTHEKADRGGTIGREMSESTEDEASLYLDGEMDRSVRMWSESHIMPPRGARYSTHDGSTAEYGFQRFQPYARQGGYPNHVPTHPSGLSSSTMEWSGEYLGVPSQPNPTMVPKRHRSMTPHLQMSRPITALSGVARATQLAAQASNSDMHGSYAGRATSLDPSSLDPSALRKTRSPLSLPTQLAHHTDRFSTLPLGYHSGPGLIDPTLTNDLGAQMQVQSHFDSGMLGNRPDITEQFTNWEHDE